MVENLRVKETLQRKCIITPSHCSSWCVLKLFKVTWINVVSLFKYKLATIFKTLVLAHAIDKYALYCKDYIGYLPVLSRNK